MWEFFFWLWTDLDQHKRLQELVRQITLRIMTINERRTNGQENRHHLYG